MGLFATWDLFVQAVIVLTLVSTVSQLAMRRWAFAFAGVVLVVAMDIPRCRTHYLSCIEADVTPVQAAALAAQETQAAGDLHNMMLCEKASAASEKRQACLESVRDAHVLGGPLSEAFDTARALPQSTKMARLARMKGCMDKLMSSTRVNRKVTLAAHLPLLAALWYAYLTAKSFALFYRERQENNVLLGEKKDI